MRVRCGAICSIALFVTSSDQESQERGVSKQIAPGAPYAHLLTDLQQFSVGRMDFDRGGRKGARRLADSSSALRSCGDLRRLVILLIQAKYAVTRKRFI